MYRSRYTAPDDIKKTKETAEADLKIARARQRELNQ